MSEETPIDTVVIMGVCGCGKTEVGALLAERLGWEFAEGDSFHPSANVAKMAKGIPLEDEDRWPWLLLLSEWISDPTRRGGVVACSALKRSYRDLLARPGVAFAHLHGPRLLLEARMSGRKGHFMPGSLLDSQLATLEPLEEDELGIVVELTESKSVGQEVDEIITRLRLDPRGSERIEPSV